VRQLPLQVQSVHTSGKQHRQVQSSHIHAAQALHTRAPERLQARGPGLAHDAGDPVAGPLVPGRSVRTTVAASLYDEDDHGYDGHEAAVYGGPEDQPAGGV